MATDSSAGRALTDADWESLRRKLEKFFEQRRVQDTADLVGESVLRIHKRIQEGEPIGALGPYSLGVAKNVFYEYLRDLRRLRLNTELTPETPVASAPHRSDREADLLCLEECLRKRLTDTDRQIVLARYGDSSGRESRASLARKLGVTSGALDTRAYSLRKAILKPCIENCRKKRAKEQPVDNTHIAAEASWR